jgi:hypothetical protein
LRNLLFIGIFLTISSLLITPIHPAIQNNSIKSIHYELLIYKKYENLNMSDVFYDMVSLRKKYYILLKILNIKYLIY